MAGHRRGRRVLKLRKPQAIHAVDAVAETPDNLRKPIKPPTEPPRIIPPEGNPLYRPTAGGLISLGVVRPPGGLAVLVRCGPAAGRVLQTRGTCGGRRGFGCS